MENTFIINNFNCDLYRYLNQDIEDLNDEDLIHHFYNYGLKEGRAYLLNLPDDFNSNNYKILNPDLKELNEKELIIHYLVHGIIENRRYNCNINEKVIDKLSRVQLPSDFDCENYRLLNNDLKSYNDTELINHYIVYAINENRKYKKDEIINILPIDFTCENYKLFNNDLTHLTHAELIDHYLTVGIFKERQYKCQVPDDFCIKKYKLLNNDLKHFNNDELLMHYTTTGFKEGRKYNFDQIDDNYLSFNNINLLNNDLLYDDLLPYNFDPKLYKFLNDDLKNLTDIELILHYIKYGIDEKRIYNYLTPYDFNPKIYKQFYIEFKNKSDFDCIYYYTKKGINEDQIYSYNQILKLYILNTYGNDNLDIDYVDINEEYINIFITKLIDIFISLISKYLNKFSFLERYIMLEYYYKLNNIEYISFLDAYTKLINNHKDHYRYLCYRYINNIKNFKIDIKYDKKCHNETVLIEFRKLHNIEFNIINTCNKLQNWKHTIVCGNNNYDFIKKICSNISNQINIIKLDIYNIDINEYSLLLTSYYFWNMLTGNHILIHQDDSLLFDTSNIDYWLKYDYVGAPWTQKHTKYPEQYLTGNGGFSLRKKTTMLNICKNYDITNYTMFDFTKKYMNKNNLIIPPEDCFFVKCIVDNNLGIIPNANEAKHFSIENINTEKTVGGHCFWICDEKWINRILKLLKQFYNDGIQYIDNYEHRFGWKNIILMLYINDIITSEKNNIQLIDLAEKHFVWDHKTIDNKKWIGILHLTPTSPSNIDNINRLLENKNFNKFTDNCKHLVCLSKHLNDYISNIYNIDTDIKTIIHPILKNNTVFNIMNYLNNNNKKIIQIGQQLRILKSFLQLNFLKHTKIWLTGTKKINNVLKLVNNEIGNNDNNINLNDYNIECKYVNNNEFDSLISNNIIFIHLYDASANNTVLESILYKTPIVVNRHPAVIEYLGKNYPLFYDNIEEVNDEFISDKNIIKAYYYLLQINIKKFSYKKFNQELLELI
jgi:hypothetical protein